MQSENEGGIQHCSDIKEVLFSITYWDFSVFQGHKLSQNENLAAELVDLWLV